MNLIHYRIIHLDSRGPRREDGGLSFFIFPYCLVYFYPLKLELNKKQLIQKGDLLQRIL